MSKTKKQSCKSNRMCFTLNNYTEQDHLSLVASLTSLLEKKQLTYAVVGKEKGQSGTHHLQGFVSCPVTFFKAAQGLVSKWRSVIPALAKAHMESARGSDLDSQKYCQKDGDFLEFGEPNVDQRSIWEKMIAATSMEEAATISPEIFIKSYNSMEKIVRNNKRKNASPPSVNHLRQWQLEVHQKLLNQCNRKILFVVDRLGNTGKSALAIWLRAALGPKLFYCDRGSSTDVAHAFSKGDYQYAVFDFPRNTQPQFLPWSVIEGLKNGVLMSSKYDSDTVWLDQYVKILVLTNHDLDGVKHSLSADRWSIVDLDQERALKGNSIFDIPQDPEVIIKTTTSDPIPPIELIPEFNEEIFTFNDDDIMQYINDPTNY